MVLVELPDDLRAALDELLQGVAPRELSRTTADLSARYRGQRRTGAPVVQSSADVLSYAAYRMPATYAASVASLSALRERRPDWRPRTMLDLGAGLGAGLWAAATVWPALEQVTAVDAQPHMIATGRELARRSAHRAARSADWRRADLSATHLTGRYDLALIAYVLGELDPQPAIELVERAWSVTAGALVIIEPGTPAGYERVLRARERIAAAGGFPIAPCPHDTPCTTGEGDWCHFSVRLPRGTTHRVAKGAQLGYEDEKFSYVALSRTPLERPYSRIVRHPRVRRGHIYLQLCTPHGPRTVVVSKRHRDLFNMARKAEWGDIFELPPELLGEGATAERSR